MVGRCRRLRRDCDADTPTVGSGDHVAAVVASNRGCVTVGAVVDAFAMVGSSAAPSASVRSGAGSGSAADASWTARPIGRGQRSCWGRRRRSRVVDGGARSTSRRRGDAPARAGMPRRSRTHVARWRIGSSTNRNDSGGEQRRHGDAHDRQCRPVEARALARQHRRTPASATGTARTTGRRPTRGARHDSAPATRLVGQRRQAGDDGSRGDGVEQQAAPVERGRAGTVDDRPTTAPIPIASAAITWSARRPRAAMAVGADRRAGAVASAAPTRIEAARVSVPM